MSKLIINKNVDMLDGDEKNIWTAEPEIEIDGIWKTLKTDSGTADGIQNFPIIVNQDNVKMSYDNRDEKFKIVAGKEFDFEIKPLLLKYEFNLPPYYNFMKDKPLSHKRNALIVSESGGEYCFSRKFGKSVVRQTFSFCKSGIVIDTSMKIGKDEEIPMNLNIFSVEKIPAAAKVFAIWGSMGSIKMKRADEYEEGEIGRNIFAVQEKNNAFLMHSEIGSAYPFVMGVFGGVWRCFVSLPAAPEIEELKFGKIYIKFDSSAQSMLENLASDSAVRKPLKKAPKCWNSWDCYHSAVSSEKILANARAIAANPVLKKHVETIVIDMGWETRFGEWAADPNFPEGMKNLADEIKKLGFKAGLWFSPIVIDPECNFFQENYEWVAKNRYGFPDRTYECCGLFGYILDVTRKEGGKYLYDLFRKFRQMGYDYFKLDFLRYMMYAHRFSDGGKTNVEVMRKSLEIIRKGAGDDAFILGCNLPFEVGPGYCDACRVSSDVAIFWEDIKRNAGSISLTYFWNGKWWINDPDFLVVRGKDTADRKEPLFSTWWFPLDHEFDEHSESCKKHHSFEGCLSLDEARVHASLELLAGGSFVLSDNIMRLNKNGVGMIEKIMSSESAPGKPLLDIFEDLPSSVWIQVLKEKIRIGLFNWDDKAKTVSVNHKRTGMDCDFNNGINFWTGKIFKTAGNNISAKLKPHSCEIIEFNIKKQY